MALTKQGSVLGFSTEIYAKINWTSIYEVNEDEAGKLYHVEAIVNFYTDSTKEYSFEQKSYHFYNVRIDSLSLQSIYDSVKSLPEFEGFVDA